MDITYGGFIQDPLLPYAIDYLKKQSLKTWLCSPIAVGYHTHSFL